ncbi:PhaM family polyhydroxyalkanoate granule multifunctional regulatory protein [Pandoraea sp. NPDC087047]|uniref:PhaM family polyhydroxyalkanoate granule multifunctional regulatory protein n=1 Tax=Pandoraea sp. NPDC087047 TaxID=3364390 RepID=UPI0037FCB5EF
MSDSTSAMPNGFDILKKMWEAFSPPATFTSPLTQLMQSAAPLLDPDEIENRIAEMRAVEQWLTLNLNVLRSTIQAFEVQRATYATLRAFGTGSFGAAGGAGTATSSAADDAGVGSFWRSPFAAAEPAQDVEPEPQASAPEPEPAPAPEGAAQGEAQAAAGADASASPFAQAGGAYGALDPSMWFNAMRSQFDQIAAAAQAAGASAAQMTGAAAAQMSEAAAKATQATTQAAQAASSSGKAPGKTSGTTAKRAAGSAKTAGKTAAKRAPASKKTPAKSAAAKTSARTSAKAGTDGKAPAKAAGATIGSKGKQAAWKW